ncbi:class I SAM-dependent DNA methyltransferase [Pontibacter roseus]|uniref:class I SAM-dependent DNA methyltransferase n=1 Tax=Pontibacter roseus TaxID=336989 RepID=UPI0003708D7E|nr:type IIL restriction-modification enzyme MmeI [Pontibacter roseus]
MFEETRSKLKSIDVGSSNAEFLYSFLRAFNFPKATISKLQLHNNSNSFLLKNKLLFVATEKANPFAELEALKLNGLAKIKARIILIANKDYILSFDKSTEDTLSVSKKELYNYFDFFLPIVGIEKKNLKNAKTANLKSAEKFAELYNSLVQSGECRSEADRRSLNIMMARLLFCFLAESIDAIEKGAIYNLISTYTSASGANLNVLLKNIFNVISGRDRADLPDYLARLPILNISLFEEEIEVPKFNNQSRKLLLDISSIDWTTVNPDILGSLVQSTFVPDNSLGLCNHYTSVSNIMKVLGPLFLDELYEIFEAKRNDVYGLQCLLARISSVNVFDPTCKAGNFLIVALKELRKLESNIHSALQILSGEITKPKSIINVCQFYGVEPNYFNTLITRIGLWITDFQTNDSEHINPLDSIDSFDASNILFANPTRIDWSRFCTDKEESYIICNPTYKGATKQTPQQKADVAYVFRNHTNTSSLDYASCWVYLSAQYIKNTKSRAALVATNSITQGQQVGLLWPKIFAQDVEIFFAHTSFKWKNSSKDNTGVTVVIIGLASDGVVNVKRLYSQSTTDETSNISPYLTTGDKTIVKRRRTPLSSLPPMPKGNMPYDDGNLILSRQEKLELVNENPAAKIFLKRLMGSKEFIHDIERWCLWITDDNLSEANQIQPIKHRIDKTRESRLSKADRAAKKLANRPHQFRETNITITQSILVPSVSSERRKYIPIDFVFSKTIISNLAFAVYNCEPWIFGVLTSKMHLLWIKAVCGSLETRIRYSSELGYNTFPFPNITEEQKEMITACVYSIIQEREKHAEKSLAQMYDPTNMSGELLHSHEVMDSVIESCYRKEPFLSDQQRLEHLFSAYRDKLICK